MKKILILVMSCNLPNYRAKERVIRETYAKDVIEGKYPNIDFWFFTSGEECIDEEARKLYIPVDDRRDRSFQKLVKTLMFVNSNERFADYDYIFRVNISTYINVALLNEFVSHLKNSDNLWTATTYTQPWIEQGAPFFSGESFLLSKKQCQFLIDNWKNNQKMFDAYEADKTPNQPTKICDDGWITLFFNRVMKEGYLNILHTFGILFESEPELKYQDEWTKYISIGLKTFDDNAVTYLDKVPLYDEIDKNKFYEIYEVLKDFKVDKNWWINVFNKELLDKKCKNFVQGVNYKIGNDCITKKEVYKQYVAKLREICKQKNISFNSTYKQYKKFEK